jgi:predicted S18 family serine protease
MSQEEMDFEKANQLWTQKVRKNQNKKAKFVRYKSELQLRSEEISRYEERIENAKELVEKCLRMGLPSLAEAKNVLASNEKIYARLCQELENM